MIFWTCSVVMFMVVGLKGAFISGGPDDFADNREAGQDLVTGFAVVAYRPGLVAANQFSPCAFAGASGEQNDSPLASEGVGGAAIHCAVFHYDKETSRKKGVELGLRDSGDAMPGFGEATLHFVLVAVSTEVGVIIGVHNIHIRLEDSPPRRACQILFAQAINQLRKGGGVFGLVIENLFQEV